MHDQGSKAEYRVPVTKNVAAKTRNVEAQKSPGRLDEAAFLAQMQALQVGCEIGDLAKKDR